MNYFLIIKAVIGCSVGSCIDTIVNRGVQKYIDLDSERPRFEFWSMTYHEAIDKLNSLSFASNMGLTKSAFSECIGF
jgi:hypothetical protein